MGIISPFSFKALSVFFEQLYDLLGAGINLNRALIIIHKLETNSKRKKIIKQIIEEIKIGKDFSDALATRPLVFAEEIVALIKAGEVSGSLHQVIGKIISMRRTLSEIKSALGKAVSYPIILFSVALIVMALLLLMVIPEFARMFAKFNAPLPPLTRVLLDISKFLQNYTHWFLFMAVVGGLTLVMVLKLSFRLKYWFDYLVLKMPLSGKILNDFIQAKFFAIASILLQADIKLLHAFKIGADTLQNKYFKRQVKLNIQNITAGNSISGTFAGSDLLTDYARQMLIVAEETGDMTKSLEKIAEYHQKRIDNFATSLKLYLEPLLIIFVSVFIGVILLGMYQPIFKLNQLF